MSADHVYRLDYRDVVDTHRAKEAEVTMVVTDLEDVYGEDPSDHAVVEVNRLGRVTSFAYKPDKPASSTVATEVFLYEPEVLVDLLEELHHELSDEPHEGDDDIGDTGLGDFGDLLLPRLVDRGKVYAHRLDGYWRDLGQPHHYLNAHLELVDREAGLFTAGWPIRTQQPQREPAYVAKGASFEDSLLSSGSRVAGTVLRSVIGPGVVVEEGAEVVESVLLGDTVVRSGARVTRSIVDTGCELLDGADIGGDQVALDDPDAIPIVAATAGSGLLSRRGRGFPGHDGLTPAELAPSPQRRVRAHVASCSVVEDLADLVGQQDGDLALLDEWVRAMWTPRSAGSGRATWVPALVTGTERCLVGRQPVAVDGRGCVRAGSRAPSWPRTEMRGSSRRAQDEAGGVRAEDVRDAAVVPRGR